MDVETLASQLAELPIPQIRYYTSIGSTNVEAMTWTATGARDGCLVVADQQTQGRGRLGRRWITQPGAALAFSLILRPDRAETAYAGLFTALGAVAVSQALEQTLGLDAKVKWPNDVLLHEKDIDNPTAAAWRKAAGILVEAAWFGDQMQGIIIGIGINVAPSAVPPADQLLFPAICVEDAVGHAVKRELLLQNILKTLFALRPSLASDEFRHEWEQRLAFKGEWVQVKETGGSPITGQITGLDDSGGLLLRTNTGETIKAAVGDVHLRLME